MMAPGTRTKKTAASYKAELEKLRKKMAEIEAKAYEGELAEAIAASNIVSEFNEIKRRYKDIAPIQILQAIGKATKIPRLVITQTEPQKRASKTSK